MEPFAPPGMDSACRSTAVEADRLEWRAGDGGDLPAAIDGFLAEHGRGPDHGRPGSACGVGVLLSHRASAVMTGAAAGAEPPSAVPDVVLVAFEHAEPSTGEPLEADPPAAEARGDYTVGEWTPTWTPGAHAEAVRETCRRIAAGDVYVLNVVGHWTAPWEGDPAALVRDVASVPGAAWGGALRSRGGGAPEWFVASASPECFVEVDGSTVRTYPIKGTAPATEAGRVELTSSVKERAEHAMVVDLLRNDLAQVSVPGSVTVEELFSLRRWRDLWQAESTVSARLRPGLGFSDLLRGACPPGSVTGTPKSTALEIIAALEPVGRGPAMGAFGFAASAGRVRLGLSIRTLAGDASRLHLWAGGGVTWRSDPDAEVAEAGAKAEGVMAALRH